MVTSKMKLGTLLVGVVVLGAGCNQGCLSKGSVFKKDLPAIGSPTSTAADIPVERVVIERMPSSLAEAPQKFIIKKDGVAVKEVVPVNGTPFTMRVFKKSDAFVYVAGYKEGIGGYILFEADPENLFQIDMNTGNVVDLTRTGLVVQDIFQDDLVAWSDPVNKKIVVRRINGNFQMEFVVPKKYAQVGNVKFSPDGKHIAYAVAVGNENKESGAVYSGNLETGKQVLISETVDPNKYLEVSGWKDATTVDYVDRGVNEK
jgi:tricorn protease-like protein